MTRAATGAGAARTDRRMTIERTSKDKGATPMAVAAPGMLISAQFQQLAECRRR
ncbi:MAG: hypothetical protein ACOH2B_08250 [Burkholderiaceae bacterium]